MVAAARYAYAHGRVSSRAGRLLSARGIEALIDGSAQEEGVILEETGWRALDPETLGEPAALEQALLDDLIGDALILARALRGADRELLNYWVRRYELANLKAIIRGKMSGEAAEVIDLHLLTIGPFASLPVDELLRIDDVASLLRRLEATPFAEIGRGALRVFEKKRERFALDAALDRHYFMGLARRVKVATGARDQDLRALMGAIIDRLNLTWLLRYRYAYGLAPAEAYYLLIPGGYRLQDRRLGALAQWTSIQDVIAHLPAALAGRLAGSVTAADVDRGMEREVWRVAGLALRRGALAVAEAFAYLVLRCGDMQKVHAVLRGKRLRLSPDRIRESIGPSV